MLFRSGFSPLQQQVMGEAANMYRPEQFGMATRYADIAGAGGIESADRAYGYGQAGYGSGMMGQNLGISGGAQYGQTGADIGLMGYKLKITVAKLVIQPKNTHVELLKLVSNIDNKLLIRM